MSVGMTKSARGAKKANGAAVKKPIRREDLPAGESLCEYCTAKCCKYMALPLPRTPKTWGDFDEIRWFLAHRDIGIFVDENVWYLLVNNECGHLMHDNRCGIYADRPQICRTYTTDNCEYDDRFCFDKIFENDAQIAEYAEALLGPRPGSGAAKGGATLL